MLLVGGASAFTDYYSTTDYVDLENVPAGGIRTASGWNYRTENDACRQYDYGWEEVWYTTVGGTVTGDSGPVWTYCSFSIAAVSTNNGYFRPYAENMGSVTHLMTAYAWNYLP